MMDRTRRRHLDGGTTSVGTATYCDMKIPRWIMGTLAAVSTTAVVIPLLWWWVNWPAFTADAFFTLVRERQWDEASTMLQSIETGPTLDHLRRCSGIAPTATLRPLDRTWVDVLVGRQTFQFDHRHNPCLTIERGSVAKFDLDDQTFFVFGGVEFFW
jgi:hypothetical protein